MNVLLLGASGFIGRSVANHAPDHVNLTGTYCNNKPKQTTYTTQRLDYLDPSTNWSELIDPYDCIVIAARASGSTPAQRRELAHRGKVAFTHLLDAVKSHPKPPHIVAVHGSLTYGDAGEALVDTDRPVRPSGFAAAYAIAESPFRDRLKDGGSIGIVRAPWVLGDLSWYRMMYGTSPSIPLVGHGKQWMSLIAVEALADCIWQMVGEKKAGIVHPPLTYRCRQHEFAEMVQGVSGRSIKRLRWWSLWRMDKQMKASIMASIRLDDGNGMLAEGAEAKKAMQRCLERLHNGFS